VAVYIPFRSGVSGSRSPAMPSKLTVALFSGLAPGAMVSMVNWPLPTIAEQVNDPLSHCRATTFCSSPSRRKNSFACRGSWSRPCRR